MRKEELEYNIKNYVMDLIDDIMPANGLLGKMQNRTAKYWVEQNQWRLDDILSVFTDKEESIDTEGLVRQYEDILFEDGEFRLCLKDLVGDKYSNLLPNKIVLFNREDLYKLVGLDMPR